MPEVVPFRSIRSGLDTDHRVKFDTTLRSPGLAVIEIKEAHASNADNPAEDGLRVVGGTGAKKRREHRTRLGERFRMWRVGGTRAIRISDLDNDRLLDRIRICEHDVNVTVLLRHHLPNAPYYLVDLEFLREDSMVGTSLAVCRQ